MKEKFHRDENVILSEAKDLLSSAARTNGGAPCLAFETWDQAARKGHSANSGILNSNDWVAHITTLERSAPAKMSEPILSHPPSAAPPDDALYSYDDRFFRYIQEGSTRAARAVVELVLRELGVESVLDVGCGAGAWIAEYRHQGVKTCLGIDGDYVTPESLLIPPDNFQSEDVTRPFNLDRQFDLVQCLEVGEHLPKSAAETLIANLVAHGEMILFSAATPGQGGENHINEQPFEFWRKLFAAHGYKPYDLFRPLLKDIKAVESWYRWNMVLYISAQRTSALRSEILHTRIPDDQPIPEFTTPLYRLRARALAPLPVAWVSKLAVWKHALVLACRSASRSAAR